MTPSGVNNDSPGKTAGAGSMDTKYGNGSVVSQVLNAALVRPEVKVLDLVKEQPDPLLWLEEQVREGAHTPDLEPFLGAPAATTDQVGNELLARVQKADQSRL